jgi:hypothetical protein
MGKSPARAALDEVIRLGVSPALGALGYRKAGDTFRRERERCVQVVNVQASKWNTAEKAAFTVNVGVFFPAVHARMELGWEPGPRGPSEAACTVRARLGALMDGRDRWWIVRPPSWRRSLLGGDPARVAEEVRAPLEQTALPWLERMADLREARDEAERDHHPFEAAACALVAGDEAAARRIVERVAHEAPQATAVIDWARRHGLLP